MLQRRVLLSKNFCFISTVQRLMCQNSTNMAPLLDGKKKKKFSELTPQEIEADVKENLIRLRKSFENDEKENIVVPIFKKSILFADQPAIKDSNGEYTYIQLYVSAKRLAIQISNICGSASMKNIGYLCANNVLSSLTQWGCWISGQVAMPLSMCHSVEMLNSLLKASKASVLIVTPDYEEIGLMLTNALDLPLLVIDHSFMVSSSTTLFSVPRVLISSLDTVIVEGTCSNDFYTKANAMLLYTMGTTGKPKGVMITHENLDAQVKSLINAWKYDTNDCLMHALPLHHSHGFINAFMCPLSVGGRIVMHDQFNSKNIWSSILGINTPVKERVNIFMAVPAVYKSLIAEYEKSLSKNVKMVDYITNYCKENVRLMVSGGSPLPTSIFRSWREITGHNILECYGTTEFGLALSNPYEEKDEQGNSKRQPGFVGLPLPNVKVRLVGTNNKVLVDCIGEYTDNVWSVRFLDTNAAQKQADTDHLKIEQTVAESMEREKREIIQFITKIFNINRKIVTENVAFVVKKAMELFKTVQKTIAKENTEQPKYTSNGIFVNEIETEHQQKSQEPIVTATQNPIETMFDYKNSENPLGELQVSGPHIFNSYYGDSEATSKAFNGDFFKTGDLATFQDGVFKILGRTNIDVIEIAGRKISSYDIESLILEHPNVRDVTVIAVPEENDKNAENECQEIAKPAKSLGVVCVLCQETQLDLDALKNFCSKSLPKNLLPTKLKIVDELPRSNMAEINREALRKLFEEARVESNKNPE